jgi:hypothetical protein
MEMLSGAFAGLGAQPGPNFLGRAGAAGLQKGEEIAGQRQQQDQAAQAQAQGDFSRKAQVTETNLRMYSMARTVGNMEEESTDKYIAQYAPTLKLLQERAPNFIEGPVKYSDFAKYNVTADNAIPFMRVARLGSDGKQVKNAQGVPQWDVEYYIVKPGMKLSNLFSKDDMATAKEMGLSWAGNDSVMTSPIELGNFLNIKSKLASWNVGKDKVSSMFKEGDAAGQNPQGSSITPTKSPEIKDPKISSLAETAATTNGVRPEYVKALITQESHGNPNAVSPTGAKGLMQLTPSMGNLYPKNPFDPEQNVNAGTAYLSQLLKTYKDDPKKAFAAYYSGPSAIGPNGEIQDTAQHSAENTQNYVNSVSSMVGLGEKPSPNPNAVPNAAPANRLSLEQWNAKNPTTGSDMEAFMGAMNGLTSDKADMIGDALAHLHSTGNDSAANNIAAFMNQGNPDFIRDHDDALTAQRLQEKSDVGVKAAEEKANFKAASDAKISSAQQAFLVPPDNFKFDPKVFDMNSVDAKAALIKQGVKIPFNFDALWLVGHLKAPISTILPVRTAQKFSPNEMDAQTGASYINEFINPGYDQKNYIPAQKVLAENASGNSKNGMAIQNAGVAAQHLTNLEQAARAMNGDLTTMPYLNSLINTYHFQTGASPVVIYNAILPIAIQEASKVSAGGAVPYEDQVKKNEDNFKGALTLAQKEGAIEAVTKLMYGRISAIDENTYDITQTHLINVPSGATKIFKNYGLDTPWEKSGAGQQQQFKPNDTSQYAQISKSGKIGMDGSGHKYIIATGQPTQ